MDPKDRFARVSDNIMRAAQLASALEVCGWPKPGNVHRTADFEDATFEQFIAGSIALGPATRGAALRGLKAGIGEIGLDEVGVGAFIKSAVCDVKLWHRGGNTHLGTIMLLIPLSASAGYTTARDGGFEPRKLGEAVGKVVKSATPEDAAEVYDAILISGASGLGRVEEAGGPPSIFDRNARRKLIKRGITLYDVLKYSAEWDSIARELTSRMKISVELGYPTLIKTYRETGNLNHAIIYTYLKILSECPDSFIARKLGLDSPTDIISKAAARGLEGAAEISRRAREVLLLGGPLTEEGLGELWRFDRELRSRGGVMNPGATADLTASSLMIAILSGLRP